MAVPLAVPAPRVLENEGLIARQPGAIQVAARKPKRDVRFERDTPKRSTLAALARSTSAGALEVLQDSQLTKPRAGGLLPPLGVKQAYPQTFRETLAYSRPALWPWTDITEDDLELEDDGGSPQRALANSSSAPQLGYQTVEESRRKTMRRSATSNALDPEAMLSPFAVQARRWGADVVITGQRLRPSSGALFRWTIVDTDDECMDDDDSPMKDASSPLQASALSPAVGSTARLKKRQLAPKQPFRVGVANQWPSMRPATVPNRRARRRENRQQPLSQQQHQQSQQPLRRDPVVSLALGAEAAAGVREAAAAAGAPGDQHGSATRLPAGPAGLWDNISSLSAVRELHDMYAADPLSAAPPCAAGDDPEAASSDFLRKYVERQAEIERLLQERGKQFPQAPRS